MNPVPEIDKVYQLIIQDEQQRTINNTNAQPETTALMVQKKQK